MNKTTKKGQGSEKVEILRVPKIKTELTLWEELSKGKVPVKLQQAARTLTELSDEGQEVFKDILCNDTPENYRAIIAALRISQSCLSDLEKWAKKNLAAEAAHHQERLQEILELGVVEVAQ